jgi:outer membrane protein TolC
MSTATFSYITAPPSRARRAAAAALAVASLLSGCSLAPKGSEAERSRALASGVAYEPPIAERCARELPPEPDQRDLLRRAFLCNGELEAAYHAWHAAAERIDIAAGYPNTNVSLGFEYLFSGGNLSGWDRTTLTVGFDPMQNLSFPTKILAAGRVAYEEARAAGERFAAAKFALQRAVLEAYLQYALLAERTRVQRRLLDLLRLGSTIAAAGVAGGLPQQDLLSADVERAQGERALAALDAALLQQRARLNGLIGRAADAPLPAPAVLPEPRPLPLDDATLLAVGPAANPELAALARTVAGRADALDLARQQYFPDINPFLGISGSMAQVVGAAITLATKLPQIQAGIREARANLRAAEAMRHQAGLTRGADFVATLVALRNAERQHALLDDHIRPAAHQAADAVTRAYSTGGSDLPALIMARRTLLDLDLAIAETRIAREQRLAELEQLAGVDAEALPVAAARSAAGDV